MSAQAPADSTPWTHLSEVLDGADAAIALRQLDHALHALSQVGAWLSDAPFAADYQPDHLLEYAYASIDRVRLKLRGIRRMYRECPRCGQETRG